LSSTRRIASFIGIAARSANAPRSITFVERAAALAEQQVAHGDDAEQAALVVEPRRHR
jgi:hypothetical protein